MINMKCLTSSVFVSGALIIKRLLLAIIFNFLTLGVLNLPELRLGAVNIKEGMDAYRKSVNT
jgi:hypothetical protein